MFKLWIKEIDDNNRITKHKTFEFQQEFDVRFLRTYIEVVCNDLKIETPILLNSHYITFNNFNRVRFAQSDFVDDIEFKFLNGEEEINKDGTKTLYLISERPIYTDEFDKMFTTFLNSNDSFSNYFG